MFQLMMVGCRALTQALRGHRELVLENLALRQQLMAMKRANSRPRLQARDRLFWIALRRIGRTGHGSSTCSTRDRRGPASHVAPPAVEPTLNTSSERPSAVVRQNLATASGHGVRRVPQLHMLGVRCLGSSTSFSS